MLHQLFAKVIVDRAVPISQIGDEGLPIVLKIANRYTEFALGKHHTFDPHPSYRNFHPLEQRSR